MSGMERKDKAELSRLIQRLQQDYAEAFRVEDAIGMIENSGCLSIAYSAVGCTQLADKWMDEYVALIERMEPSLKGRLQTLRDLLPN